MRFLCLNTGLIAMKWLIRIFFKTVRAILGPILLLGDWLTTPKSIKREAEDQNKINEDSKQITLYQFKACPFCIKTRRVIKRLALNVQIKDAQHNQDNRQQLLQGGGQIKVPCIHFTDEQGQEHWMYESSDIIRFLEERYP